MTPKRKRRVKVEDISKPSEKLSELNKEDFKPLPAPFDKPENTPDFPPLDDKARETLECTLDDTVALNLPKPQTQMQGATNEIRDSQTLSDRNTLNALSHQDYKHRGTQ